MLLRITNKMVYASLKINTLVRNGLHAMDLIWAGMVVGVRRAIAYWLH